MSAHVLRRAVVGVVIGSILAGCGGDRRDRAAVTVDTLPSGAVRVHNTGDGLWAEGEGWSVVEQVRIGSAEPTDTIFAFEDIWDVTFDALGRIYVLDRGARGVRVFDRAGNHVRTLGRGGRGPGEFWNPTGLGWGPGGELWVADPGNARYEVFDTAGKYLYSRRRRIGSWSYPWGGGFDGRGRLYESQIVSVPGTNRYRGLYIRHETRDSVVATDTFPLPVHEPKVYRIRMGDRRLVTGVPFAPELTWRFDGRNGFWFGVSDAYRLIHRTLEGDTTMIVTREYTPIPVTDDDMRRTRESFERLGPGALEQVDLSLVPDVKPAFETFVIDDRGYLWVVRTPAAPGARVDRDVVFDIFDPSGRYLGAVPAPVGIYPPPRIVGDRLLGVTRDELDVPAVVVLTIQGRSPA
jgi:hypothetical protein